MTRTDREQGCRAAQNDESGKKTIYDSSKGNNPGKQANDTSGKRKTKTQ